MVRRAHVEDIPSTIRRTEIEGMELEEITPAREKMAEVEPVKERIEAPEERLKTLELYGLPVTTPETRKEVIEPSLSIPRGALETALATGTGIANFVSGAVGYRMLSELAKGKPLDEAIEEGGKGLYVYQPETAIGQRMSEEVGKVFEVPRRAAEASSWRVVTGVRDPQLRESLTQEQIKEVDEIEKSYPYVSAALGSVAELAIWGMFGHALRRRTGKAKPTVEQVKEAATEAVRTKKAETPPVEEVKPKLPPEAEELSATLKKILEPEPEEAIPPTPKPRPEVIPEPPLPDISPVASTAKALEAVRQEKLAKLPIEIKTEALEEAFGRKLTAAEESQLAAGWSIEKVIRTSIGIREEVAPPKTELGIVRETKMRENLKATIEAIKRGEEPPILEAPREWFEHMEKLWTERLATAKEKGDLVDLRRANQELDALRKYYRPSKEYKKPAEVIPIEPSIEPKVLDVKAKNAIKAMDAEGLDSFKIAERLKLKESEVGNYLESEWFKEPKKIVKMDEVEAEAKSLLKEAKDLDEAYEKIRELTTRYEDNIEVSFLDEFERHRYREWGDDILGKIVKARRDQGMPDPPAVTLESFGLQHYYEFLEGTGKKLADSLRKRLGTTDKPIETMFIDREGNRIRSPRLDTIHHEIDTLNFGKDVFPGETARRLGWLEIRDTRDLAWVRAYTRLSEKQVEFLRNLSRERTRLDMDLNDAEGVPIRDFTKEDLPQFIARARPAAKTPAQAFEIMDFGGFQKMYESLVGSIRGKAKKPLSARAEYVLNRGAIIKQRKRGERIYPPVYEAEYHILKGAKVLDETFFRRAFTNPFRVFEEAGGEPLLDLTTHPYHAAEKAFVTTWEHAQKSLNKIEKQFSRRERRNIMTHAIAEQDKGEALLKFAGIKKIPKLTSKEMDGYIQLRGRYESLFKRINRVRRACGIKEFPKQENYFTFFRSMSLMEELGFRPFEMPMDVFNKQYIKMRSTPFKFARRRTKALYRLEMDPFWVIKRYEHTALRHMHMSPLVAKVREYLNVLKDPATEEAFDIKVENPVLARALDGWISHIAGQRHPMSLGPRADAMIMRINSNLVASTLGANLRSALIQPTALRNTVAEIGFEHTSRGVASLIDPKRRNFALKKSKVLVTRKAGAYDVTAQDALRAIRTGKTAEARAVMTKTVLKPLQVLDYEAALATWQGAYEFGVEKLGLTAKRAIIYADDVVAKTQASALSGDIAPVQRPAVGRLLTLFQTFTINDWNFFVRDVLGKRNATINTPKAFTKAMRYVAATTLFNILYEDVLGLNSPFPTPIRAYKESIDRGDEFPSMMWNVSKEFIEPIPIIGAARYGLGPGGPSLELANESVKYIAKKPMRKPFWDIFGRWIGAPGTAQISKSKRAAERGESTWGILAGTYTPPPRVRPTRPRTRRRTRR